MRINVYRIRYHVMSAMNESMARANITEQIKDAAHRGDFLGVESLRGYLKAHKWPESAVVSGPHVETVAAESEEKALEGLPQVPEGQFVVIQQIHTQMKDVLLST